MEHSFDVKVAQEVGIAGAILLKHVHHWCTANRLNDRNYHDGKYWMYDTMKVMAETFPYMTERIVANELRKLREGGYLLTGRFNRHPCDRTMWYTLSDKGEAVLCDSTHASCENQESKTHNGEMESENGSLCATEREFSCDKSGGAIPHIETHIETHIDTHRDTNDDDDDAGARACVREGEPEEDRTSPDWGMSEEDKAVRKVLLEFVPCGISPPNQYTADDIEGMVTDSQWGLTPDARADTIIRAMRAVGEAPSEKRGWGNVKGLLRYWQKNGERGKKVNANASNGSFEGREGYSWDDAELERFNREFYDVYVAGGGKSG